VKGSVLVSEKRLLGWVVVCDVVVAFVLFFSIDCISFRQTGTRSKTFGQLLQLFLQLAIHGPLLGIGVRLHLYKHFLHGTQPGTGKHLSKHSPIFFFSAGVNFSSSRLGPNKDLSKVSDWEVVLLMSVFSKSPKTVKGSVLVSEKRLLGWVVVCDVVVAFVLFFSIDCISFRQTGTRSKTFGQLLQLFLQLAIHGPLLGIGVRLHLYKHFLHGTQPGTGKHLSKHSPIFFFSAGVNFSSSRLGPNKDLSKVSDWEVVLLMSVFSNV